MKSSILWDITSCSPLRVNWLFGGTYRLHLQGRRISLPLSVTLFHVGFLLYLVFDPEDGDLFLRNVGWHSTDYTEERTIEGKQSHCFVSSYSGESSLQNCGVGVKWKRKEGLLTSGPLESLTELRLDIHPKSSCSLKQQKILETISKQPHRWCLHHIVLMGFECSWDPESYASGSVATGRGTHAGQVKG
jgi:hypothetical protein